MTNILVPLDFSNCSFRAVEYAVDLSKMVDGKLIILHAVQVPILADGDSMTGSEIREEVQTKFDEVVKQVPQLGDIPHEFELSFELITSSIRRKVDEDHVDLIVMGTKGATGAKEIFIGSNTYETIKHINCPLIAIPENIDRFRLGSVAFASDYKQIDNYQDLDAMMNLAKIRNTEIHILHIGEDNKINRDEMEVGRNQDQYFKSVRHSYHFINGSNIAEEIKQYVKGNGIDMLALYARRHDLADKLFHQSVTQEMAFHSEVPLLVLPETA